MYYSNTINNIQLSIMIILQIFTAVLCAVLLVAFLRERSKQLSMRRALRRESRQLEEMNRITSAILKNVHAYVLLINADFKVLKTNYYHLTHTSEEEKEKRVGDLLQCHNALSAEGGCGTHALCASCPVRAAISRAFTQKKNFVNLEAMLNVVVSADQSVECYAQISGSYLLLNEEECMVLTVHDVTRLKKVEEQLVKEREKAENADRSKSTFLANMSHEIRTPLNAITGFAEVLAAATSEEEKAQYQEIIKMNADLLLQLVNDILDLSKIEAGTLEFVYADVDINLLISDLWQLFRMKLNDAQSKVEVQTQLPLDSCVIRSDRNRVAQVISNFVTNAIKFTTEGSICIGYEVRGAELYFFVKDTGQGIPADKLPQVFCRFVKLHKDKKGTGLGLSICQTIVEKLGGRIGADSVEGEGSVFWFTLPYRTVEQSQTETKTPVTRSAVEKVKEETPVVAGDNVKDAATSTASSRRPTVLIAEDIEDNYRLCEAILSSTYDLLWAHNGEEAISLFLQHQPDVILMDLRMPEVDGYEATQAIRNVSTTVPIIALTAFAYEEDKQRVLQSGFTGFMTKPLSAKMLIQKLREVTA